MEKITLMGLNKIFTEGRELDFSCEDNKIIIEAVIAKFEDENDFDVLDMDKTDTLGEESTIMAEDDIPFGFSGEDCEELDAHTLMEMEEGE